MSLEASGPERRQEDPAREARRQDTVAAIRGKRTLSSLWDNGEPLDNVLMENRAVAAARFVPAGMSVLDVGCGSMLIERHLPAGCRYLPIDCVQRDARTVLCDLNRDSFPTVSADLAIALGVLEYLHNVPLFLRRLRKPAPKVLISYFPLDKDPARDRLAMRWVNALNSAELVALLRYAGYRTVRIERYAPKLLFFLAEAKSAAGAPWAAIKGASARTGLET